VTTKAVWICDRCEEEWRDAPHPVSFAATLSAGFGGDRKVKFVDLCSFCRGQVESLLWLLEHPGECSKLLELRKSE